MSTDVSFTPSSLHTPPTAVGRSTGTFSTTPLTSRCAEVAARRTHACVGISPFNGYFHAERIAELARWAISTFEAVHFFIPDSLAVHTLEAVGYPPQRAAWKARRQGQHLQNKVTSALDDLGVAHPSRLVLTTSDLAGNRRYASLAGYARELFDADRAFRTACLQAADWVLQRRLPPGAGADAEQRQTASRYLLGELPLFLDTPGIVGVAESVFCYHQTPRFLRQVFEQRLACRPAPGQGFLEVAPTGASGGAVLQE